MEFGRLETEFREAVTARRQSFSQGKVKGIFYPGRVTFDPKGMEAYAVSHPEVNQYRKVGKAFVQLRFVDDTAPAKAGEGG